jgi:hypothetical protein
VSFLASLPLAAVTTAKFATTAVQSTAAATNRPASIQNTNAHADNNEQYQNEAQ